MDNKGNILLIAIVLLIVSICDNMRMNRMDDQTERDMRYIIEYVQEQDSILRSAVMQLQNTYHNTDTLTKEEWEEYVTGKFIIIAQ